MSFWDDGDRELYVPVKKRRMLKLQELGVQTTQTAETRNRIPLVDWKGLIEPTKNINRLEHGIYCSEDIPLVEAPSPFQMQAVPVLAKSRDLIGIGKVDYLFLAARCSALVCPSVADYSANNTFNHVWSITNVNHSVLDKLQLLVLVDTHKMLNSKPLIASLLKKTKCQKVLLSAERSIELLSLASCLDKPVIVQTVSNIQFVVKSIARKNRLVELVTRLANLTNAVVFVADSNTAIYVYEYLLLKQVQVAVHNRTPIFANPSVWITDSFLEMGQFDNLIFYDLQSNLFLRKLCHAKTPGIVTVFVDKNDTPEATANLLCMMKFLKQKPPGFLGH